MLAWENVFKTKDDPQVRKVRVLEIAQQINELGQQAKREEGFFEYLEPDEIEPAIAKCSNAIETIREYIKQLARLEAIV